MASDKLLHLVGYAGVAFAALLFCRRPSSLLLAAAATFLGGTLMEFLQHFTPWRSFDVADMAANLAGALTGLLLALPLLPLVRWLRPA